MNSHVCIAFEGKNTALFMFSNSGLGSQKEFDRLNCSIVVLSGDVPKLASLEDSMESPCRESLIAN